MCAWDETESTLIHMVHKKHPGPKVPHCINNNHERTPATGADPGFLKSGVHLQAKKKGGGAGEGPILGPMLKSLHRGPKRGVRTPWTPPPPGSAPEP